MIDKDIDNKLLISVAGRLFEAGELTTGCWHYIIDVQFRSSQEPHHPQPLRARYPQSPQQLSLSVTVPLAEAIRRSGAAAQAAMSLDEPKGAPQPG